MTEYGRIHTDGSRSGGQPVVATQKAHTMVLEVLKEWGIAVRHTTAQQLAVATTEALCRALDQLEDLRQSTRVMTLEGVEVETQKLVEEASTQSGMTISEWVSARLKLAATQALSAATQSDVLKAAGDAIRGLLDITSDYNLDSEQAGRAYAALHDIDTALKGQSK